MSKSNGKWSYDFSWTQPYVNMEGFGLFSEQFKGMNSEEVYQDLSVKEEIDRLDETEETVQNMLTYPEAQSIIADIMKQRKISK